MAKSDGFLQHSERVDQTKILPLRWFATLCNYIATRSLVKAFDLDEQENFGYRFKFHCKVWKYLNKPYERWGTYWILKRPLDKLTDSEFTDT
jgi:hypothetical protein